MSRKTTARLPKYWLFPALGALLLALAACGGPPSGDGTAPPADAYPPPAAPLPTSPPAESYPAPGDAGQPAPTAAFSGPAEALVAQATADLVLRASVDPASVQVLEVTQQSWPDASLGCPQEGQLYAQVVTDGFRIVLEAGGQRYAYHTDAVMAVYCEGDVG